MMGVSWVIHGSIEFQFRKARDEARRRDREMGKREREGRGDGGRNSPGEQFLSGASLNLTFDPESGTLGVNFLGERRGLQLHRGGPAEVGSNFVTLGSVLTAPLQSVGIAHSSLACLL